MIGLWGTLQESRKLDELKRDFEASIMSTFWKPVTESRTITIHAGRGAVKMFWAVHKTQRTVNRMYKRYNHGIRRRRNPTGHLPITEEH